MLKYFHPVFHVSLVKPYVLSHEGFKNVGSMDTATQSVPQPDVPPIVLEHGPAVSKISEILDDRGPTKPNTRGNRARNNREFFVSWHGLDASHNAWVPASKVPAQMIAEYDHA